MTDLAATSGSYRYDEDALIASVEALGRAGAKEFNVGYLDDGVPIHKARWWAYVQYRGARIQVDEHTGPVEAAEALVKRVLHGAKCTGCGKLVMVSDDPVPIPATLVDGTPVDEVEVRRKGLCPWERQGRRWERGCGASAPQGSTREKLARAMAEAGCPSDGIRQARAGYYDDYLSPHPFPISTLVADLTRNGFRDLAERAKQGEFDGTDEESDAWMRSDEGQATLAQLVGRPPAAGQDGRAPTVREAPAGQQTRTDGRPAWRSNRRRAGKPGKKNRG